MITDKFKRMFIHRLQRIFNPEHWGCMYPVDWDWDEALNKAMDDGVPVRKISDHTCVIGKSIIWIASYPYSYGYLYKPHKIELNEGFRGMPSVPTKKRLRKYIDSFDTRDEEDIKKKPSVKDYLKDLEPESKE